MKVLYQKYFFPTIINTIKEFSFLNIIKKDGGKVNKNKEREKKFSFACGENDEGIIWIEDSGVWLLRWCGDVATCYF